MTDTYLEIEGLTVKTKIGVHAWEQKIDQTLRLNITCPLPHQVGNLGETVDYAALCSFVTKTLSEGQFTLIEGVAEQVADLILKQFPVETVTVRVSKPLAVGNASNISVKVTRPSLRDA